MNEEKAIADVKAFSSKHIQDVLDQTKEACDELFPKDVIGMILKYMLPNLVVNTDDAFEVFYTLCGRKEGLNIHLRDMYYKTTVYVNNKIEGAERVYCLIDGVSNLVCATEYKNNMRHGWSTLYETNDEISKRCYFDQGIKRTRKVRQEIAKVKESFEAKTKMPFGEHWESVVHSFIRDKNYPLLKYALENKPSGSEEILYCLLQDDAIAMEIVIAALQPQRRLLDPEPMLEALSNVVHITPAQTLRIRLFLDI